MPLEASNFGGAENDSFRFELHEALADHQRIQLDDGCKCQISNVLQRERVPGESYTALSLTRAKNKCFFRPAR